MRFLLFTLLAALPCLADDASKSGKVEEYLRLAKMDSMFKQTLELTMNQVKSGMLEQMFGTKIPPEFEKSLSDFQDRIGRLLIDALSWDKLQPKYVKLLADAYTDEELDDILVFYRSKSGQSMVAKAPLLMPKSMEIVQQQMATVAPELQKLMKEFMEDAAKKPAK